MRWWQVGAEETLSRMAQSSDQEPHLMYLMLQIGVFSLEIRHPRLSRSEDGAGRENWLPGHRKRGAGVNMKLVIYKDNHRDGGSSGENLCQDIFMI